MRNCSISFLIVFSVINIVRCQIQSECHAWSEIEDRLKLQSDNLSCLKNDICTGMNCSGSFQGEEFHAGLQIYPCEHPSFIAAFIDIPQLNIHNWRRSFTQGSMFDLSDKIKGEISLQKAKDKFTVGITIKVLTDMQKYFSKLRGSAPLKFPIFNGTVFPILPCELAHVKENEPSVNKLTVSSTALKENVKDSALKSNMKIYGNCTINNSSCQKNETCMQIDKSYPDGICVCRPLYTRYKTGKCIYTPQSAPTESDIIPVPESQAAHESGLSMTVLSTSILISVASILLIIGITYVSIRFKVFQYLRRKFRVQVYEHVLLGQQEDNDEPLTDPVA